MTRAQWITLLVLAALAALMAPLVGAGVVALSTAGLLAAEPLPTLMAPVTMSASAVTGTPTEDPSTATSAVPVEIASEPSPSPEVAESAPTLEASPTELPAEPTATAIPTNAPAPVVPTAVAAWAPVPTLEPAAPAVQTEPTATPWLTETPLPTDTPRPTDTPLPTDTPVPTPTLNPVVAQNLAAFFVSPLTPHAGQIFLQGRNLGNRPGAFALVGDSNTDNPNFFAPLDNGNYRLGEYAYLQETIDFFRGSFAQHSPAAVGSFNTSKVLDPAYADPARCLIYESPLVCEYRLQRPSVALILIGTGDHLDWANFEGRYRRILDYTLAQGVIPVLLTKADDLESVEQGAPYDFTNNVIRRLSREYDLPLLDLRRVVELLPNHGCVADGFHYNTPPDGRSADFTGAHLSYGYNVRNLTGLLALDELRRQVLQP